MPDVVKMAVDCEKFGAEGITVHPRPDERHIRYNDVIELKKVVTTEFNIEGYPDERYMELVKRVKPDQATLVPDPPEAITSNAGWDTITNKEKLKEIIAELKREGIRTSIFVDPVEKMVEGAMKTGTDSIELYTESYASNYANNREEAIFAYIRAAEKARELGLGINAGHDLNLENLQYFKECIPYIDEVSIGHALICDALYYGMANTIGMYKKKLSY
jgi:pyridoxine 5-phosphate synthase